MTRNTSYAMSSILHSIIFTVYSDFFTKIIFSIADLILQHILHKMRNQNGSNISSLGYSFSFLIFYIKIDFNSRIENSEIGYRSTHQL